ncbi:MAG: RNA methyltransferase [Candidatus Amoebophilus sp. 36-38]|nr:MAG: RNA methyltransferase [Candidatus Amoebophilus sp. 36-38]
MKKLSLQELNRKSIEAFRTARKLPLVLVLDNIRSMHNIGAAFRIADAFLVEKIYLCGITAQPPHREIHKTALGAEETVAWEYASDSSILLQHLKKNGYLIVGLEQTDKSLLLYDYPATEDQKYALVVGNEVFGINEEALAACDIALEIPQYGTKHSLNVAVSMGIAVWEIAKRQLKRLS